MKYAILLLFAFIIVFTTQAQNLSKLFHYTNKSTGGHFYTVDTTSIQKDNPSLTGKKIEGVVHIAPDKGTSPVYAYLNQWSYTHFYTLSKDEIRDGDYGYRYQGIAFYAYKTEQPGTIPLYRYFSKPKQAHLYTTNYNEYGKGKDTYVLEGIAGYIFPKNKTVKAGKNTKTADLLNSLVTKPGIHDLIETEQEGKLEEVQIMDEDVPNTTETFLKKLFANVQPSQFADLVPYYSNGKWGYIDRNTKMILIPAVFYDIHLFNPDLRVYYNSQVVNITGSGNFETEPKQESYLLDLEDRNTDTKVRSSAGGFKGFEVSSTGELIAYSDLYQYNKQGIPGWNIQLFKYQNRYYGIVKNLEGKAGIIDQQGNPLKGFEFNYNEIFPNRNTKDTANTWFFVKKNETDNYSLINTKGELRFKNEIFSYPLLSGEIFGYTTYQKGDTSGIFDRYTMQWVVRPQSKMKIEGLFYSSKKRLNVETPDHRKEALIYYLVSENGNWYFMDLKGNKYLPVTK